MAGLKTLSSNLNKDDIKYTQKLIQKYILDSEFIIKDIFPYTYFNTIDHYNHTLIPDIKYFD